MAFDPERVGPDDPRYRAVVEKRFNKRFVAAPDYVRVARSTGDVVGAVGDAVRENRRIVVTSGGHCLEGFVSDPDVKVIVDVSAMKRVAFDADRGAVMVEAGATVGEMLRALAENWGVVVPLGEYPGIGTGGHVAGGAFGFLCRELGLAADYLHAVEVVTVDADGSPRTTVATRDPADPNHDLWWALTGAGGGNFGIITRQWFRSQTAAPSTDPTALLPRAPAAITTFRAEWSWDAVDRAAFARLLANHGAWSEQTAAPDSPHASLWNLVAVHRKQLGQIVVRGLTTAAADAAFEQIHAFLDALTGGTDLPATQVKGARLSWLDFALDPFPELFTFPPGGVSVKGKDALLKRRLTDRQIDVAYDHLTSTDHDVMGGMLGLGSYGGAINRVTPGATASAHRDAVVAVAPNTGWLDPADEAKNLAWVRAFYRDLFADAGGVPVPGDAYAGAFINHPDVDLADPALNTSGVPWHTVYFRDGYPRLQRVKARWDPRDVFRHALSIRLPPDL
jgi:aclacinomycin oxidase